jgi:hypothetical protein
MTRKKTFKSLAELSADSIGAAEAEPEKTKHAELQLRIQAPPIIPPNKFAPAPQIRGYQGWGINE